MDRVETEIELRETLDRLTKNVLADFLSEGYGGYSSHSLRNDPKLLELVYDAFSEQLLDFDDKRVGTLLLLAKEKECSMVKVVATRPATRPTRAADEIITVVG